MLSKGATWKVLDKGYVKYIGSMGDDAEIVEAARMSTGRGFVSWDPYRRCKNCEAAWTFDPPLTCNGETVRTQEHESRAQPFPRGDAGFLEYIYSHKHMTPFEMPDLIIEFKAPIVVVWEWVRHRTQSYNIESGRYIQLANEHYLPPRDRFAKQSQTNKQDSSLELFSQEDAASFIKMLEEDQDRNYETYNDLVQHGVAKEVARLNAPMSRYTRGRAKANLRNWLAFLLLRKRTTHSQPQWEISQYADVIGKIIETLYPKTYALFEEYTLYAETFSRSELRALRSMMREFTNNSQTWGRSINEAGLDGQKKKLFLQKLELTI